MSHNILRAKIEHPTPTRGMLEKSLEKGFFLALSDLIKLEQKIIWDAFGTEFYLSGGYRIHKCTNGVGVVLDPYDEEIYLTAKHIDKLFALAESKKR